MYVCDLNINLQKYLITATYITLTTSTFVDIVGIESLISAMGVVTLVRGSGSMAGPPIAGRQAHLESLMILIFRRIKSGK